MPGRAPISLFMEKSLVRLPEPASAPEPRQLWAKLGRVLAHVPFADDLLAAYYCALDEKTPARARAMLFGAVAYFILPVDAIPDFVLGMGFTDDAAVIAAVIALFGRHVNDGHRARARERLRSLRADRV